MARLSQRSARARRTRASTVARLNCVWRRDVDFVGIGIEQFTASGFPLRMIRRQ